MRFARVRIVRRHGSLLINTPAADDSVRKNHAAPAAGIGTLNEGPLHEAIKTLYAEPSDGVEVAVDRFVADVMRVDGSIVEVQTGNLGAMKKKLNAWIGHRAVTVVLPITGIKHILKVSPDGELIRRRSPKRGALIDVVDELVSIPAFVGHANFRLDVLLTEEEELRIPDKKRTRKGWRVAERRLLGVHGSPDDRGCRRFARFGRCGRAGGRVHDRRSGRQPRTAALGRPEARVLFARVWGGDHLR